ncbi:protein of unknown function DUF1295 [Desulfonatronospira thiodismutans ASO3-1]|uniref:Uncharacterized protein n=2 Tax=Desulfonatronospira thiodismutans TaxID=488939 RepID=D6SML0_9BACT|nr:protein of unknown function DUF1295 [Desulfonatronospira thiodismutans ASO3-1]
MYNNFNIRINTCTDLNTMPLHTIILLNLAAVMLLMLAAWILSLARDKACVADSFWGAGFVLIAWLTWFMGPETFRSLLVALLISIWGIRLILHITRRNWGQPEDRRYQAMRDYHGESFRWISLFKVFMLQGSLLWIIALAPQVAQASPRPGELVWLDFLGIFIWALGMLFEVVGDYQMSQFKKDPSNRGRVMDRGLWGWTRHPNYFGECLVWWGIFCIALSVPGGWMTIISPLLITFLLVRVSGVAMLEKDMGSRRPEYENYKKRVSAFVPWFPLKNKEAGDHEQP